MTNYLKLSVLFCISSLGLCFVSEWAFAAVVASFVLFGFVLWAERFTQDQAKLMDTKIQDAVAKIKELDSRVNTLNLSKSLGR